MKNRRNYTAANNIANYTLHGNVAADARQRIAKIDRAMPVAIVATVLGALSLPMIVTFSNATGFFAKLILAMMPLAMILGAVSYILGSGFGGAFAVVNRISHWGWFLVPVFPVDIFIGAIAFMIGMGALLFFPALVLLNAKRKAKRDLREATQFAQGWEQAAA